MSDPLDALEDDTVVYVHGYLSAGVVSDHAPRRLGSRPRKYGPGDYVTNLLQLDTALMRGQWFWWKGRPLHPSVVKNWSFWLLRRAIHSQARYHRRALRLARVTDEYTDWLRDELLGKEARP